MLFKFSPQEDTRWRCQLLWMRMNLIAYPSCTLVWPLAGSRQLSATSTNEEKEGNEEGGAFSCIIRSYALCSTVRVVRAPHNVIRMPALRIK